METRRPGPVAAALLAALLASCTPPTIYEREDAGAVLAHLGRRIPAGTPAHQARAVLESEGFECRLLSNEIWVNATRPDTFLHGDRHTARNAIARRWQVAVFLDGGRARSIDAATGLIGP